jgi:hypothetical protein
LLSLLQIMRRHPATDPLDYIYGLLRVAADSADFPTPDYTRSVAELYTQVTRTWVQRDNNMSSLADYSIQGAFEISGLPSWAPNWAGFRNTLLPVPYKHYHAAGETKASLKIRDEMPRCLQVFGLPQATIAYVESFDIFDAFENEVEAALIVLKRGLLKISRIFTRILRDCTSTSEHSCLTGTPSQVSDCRHPTLRSLIYSLDVSCFGGVSVISSRSRQIFQGY